MAQTITHKKTNENPFFHMGATLDMLQNVSKLTDKPSKSLVAQYLSNAWKECKDALDKRQMFFSIVFSLGDITDRQHNVFRKKGIKDPLGGGKGLRKVFLYCLEWMHNNCRDQFYRFLPLYGEYYNLGAATMFDILWTDRWKGTVTERFKLNVDVEILTEFIASVLKDRNTSDNELALWAKWLWHIPSGKRRRKFVVTDKGLKSVHKRFNTDAKVGDVVARTGDKQAVTLEKDKFVISCIEALSIKMGWEVKKHAGNTQYIGYRAFRTRFMVESEARMFSQGAIRNLDQVQLLAWFDQLPGGARHRVQRRIVDKAKTGNTLTPKTKWMTNKGLNIGQVYIEWLNGKEQAQKTLRSLSVEDKTALAKEDPNKLKQMEKAAKVNIGGESLIDTVANMFNRSGTTQEANLKAEMLLKNVKLEVPVLICADISYSMLSHPITYKGTSFTPNALAKLLTTVFLLKNPDPELAEMFIRFDDKAEVIADGTEGIVNGRNRFMSKDTTLVNKLIDRSADFVTNFNSVSKWVIGRGSTHFNVVANHLKAWVDEGGEFKQLRIEMINKYAVFLILTDGAFNSHEVPAQTLLDFQAKMRQWFGWEGVIVIWDVNNDAPKTSQFKNLSNVIHYIGFDASMVTQIFTNLHDLDIIDIYTVLESYHKSNRYQPVRELVS